MTGALSGGWEKVVSHLHAKNTKNSTSNNVRLHFSLRIKSHTFYGRVFLGL